MSSSTSCKANTALSVWSFESLVPGFVIIFSFPPTILKKFHFSVVVPLIATVGLNNKVTFLEKDGTGQVEVKLCSFFAIDSFYD